MDERLKDLADSQEEVAAADLASECGNYWSNWSARPGLMAGIRAWTLFTHLWEPGSPQEESLYFVGEIITKSN